MLALSRRSRRAPEVASATSGGLAVPVEGAGEPIGACDGASVRAAALLGDQRDSASESELFKFEFKVQTKFNNQG